MVKNYLVCAVRPIEDGWHLEKNQDLYAQYRQMYDLRLASFRKFVKEPFEAILWTDPVKNNDEYTIANWNAIKELWHKEPCNIFWAGADTLMTQPTSLFSDTFKEYRMFNYTDPKSHREFEHYFNDDIQYYKIGITNRNFSDRFSKDKDKNIVLLLSKLYSNGYIAKKVEKFILTKFKNSRINAPNLLNGGGNTELFNIDILRLDA